MSYNFLSFNLLRLYLCELSEHLVRTFRTYCANNSVIWCELSELYSFFPILVYPIIFSFFFIYSGSHIFQYLNICISKSFSICYSPIQISTYPSINIARGLTIYISAYSIIFEFLNMCTSALISLYNYGLCPNLLEFLSFVFLLLNTKVCKYSKIFGYFLACLEIFFYFCIENHNKMK